MQKFFLFFLTTIVTCTVGQSEFELFDLPDFQIDPATISFLEPVVLAPFTKFFKKTFINYFETANINPNELLDIGKLSVPLVTEGNVSIRNLDDVHLLLRDNSGISNWIFGTIHFCNVTLSGVDSIEINPHLGLEDGTMSVGLKLNITNILIEGRQDLDITLSRTNRITANEAFSFQLTGLLAEVLVGINNPLTQFNVSTVEIPTLTFEDINVFFDNSFRIGPPPSNPTPIDAEDWEDLSSDLSSRTSPIRIILRLLRLGLPNLLQPLLHDLLDECNLFNVIFGQLRDCMGIEFGADSPETEDPESEEVSGESDVPASLVCPAPAPAEIVEQLPTSTPKPTPGPSVDDLSSSGHQVTASILLSLLSIKLFFTC